LALAALAACAALAATPALASAETVWVNRSAPAVTPPGSSCAAPGYNTIQEALENSAAGVTVNVCSSTYREQLRIEKAVSLKSAGGAVVVALPASTAHSATACDVPPEEEDVISVCVAGKVKISGFTVEGRWPAGTCNDNLFGIFAGGGAILTLTKSKVLHAGADPINGCQGGVGIQIGRNRTAQAATAMLSGDLVTGYQKNGITVDGKGSKATITKDTIVGAGKEIEPGVPTNIAQNGIQVSRGAVGKIAESTMEDNECEASSCGPNEFGYSPWQEEEDATGVLFYKEGKGSYVNTSTISTNDIGVEHLAEIEPTKPVAAITSDKLKGNRFWSVALDQGYATVNKDTIEGPSLVGIQLVQYGTEHNGVGTATSGQEFGPRGTGTEDTITGMTEWAIEGFSDNQPADEPGSFTISNSKISGNPGGTPATSVHTNNPSKLQITLGAGNT
jgi:hypothetical protein